MAKIIVIEDQLLWQQTLKVLLEQEGHEVILAGSYEKTQTYLSEPEDIGTAFDLILLNLFFQEWEQRVEGKDLLAWIEKKNKSGRAKVIIFIEQEADEDTLEITHNLLQYHKNLVVEVYNKKKFGEGKKFLEIIQKAITPVTKEDWGEAPDVPIFFGRLEEFVNLEEWIIKDRCRLIAILGMAGIGKTGLSIKLGKGGIGKTDLTLKLAQGIKEDFEYVIWRRLLNTPPIQEILSEVIKFLSDQQEIDLSDNVDEQISQLLYHLKKHRCLLILDNMEMILRGGEFAGTYREGYENYGKLLRQVGEIPHQSCLLLTSREKPQEVAFLEGNTKPVRSLELTGLNYIDGRKIFEKIADFSGSDEEWQELIEFYDGNPLALELAAKHIQQVFFGNITEFLKEGKPMFTNLHDLLDWHFERLSDLEKEVMYWLAINREPISISDMKEELLSSFSKEQLPLTLQSLQWQVPLERSAARFTLQPVLIEYMTERLVEQVGEEIKIKPTVADYAAEQLVKHVSEEIKTGRLELLNRHALLKALAKNYVRESQNRLILKPIIDKLLLIFKDLNQIEIRLKQILSNLQKKHPQEPGYSAGNILNLLCQIDVDLSGYDFSNLTIWQAYLRKVKLYNVNFAYCIIDKSAFIQTFGGILAVAFSPNGQFLAASDTNRKTRLWRVIDRQPLLVFTGHTNWTRAIAFSPNNQLLVTGNEDQTLKLWDILSGKEIKTLKGHTDWLRTVTFNHDGQLIASGGNDQTIKIWNISTGECLNTLREHEGTIWSISFSPDGHLLASGSGDKTVRIWNTESGECIAILKGHRDYVRSVTFSSDGRFLASGSDDKTIILWDILEKKRIKNLEGHNDRVWSVAFHQNCSLLASSSDDQTIKLWEVISGRCLNTLQGHLHRIRSIEFSPDGQILLSGSEDKTIRLWQVSDGKCLDILQGYSNRLWAVMFSPNGKILISGGEDGIVRIWHVNRGDCIGILQEHTNWIQSVAFSSNGQMIASCSNDQMVKLWDIQTLKCIKTFHGHNDWIRTVTFSPDGHRLASGGADHTIKIWDIKEGNCLKTLPGHSDSISSVAFSSDGQIIVSGSEDKTIKFWDIHEGKCLITLHTEPGFRIWSVVFSPDGQVLASGSEDNMIRLWDIHTGECIKALQGHTNWVKSIAFSHDGQKIVSGSEDQTVRLWNIESGECLQIFQGHTGSVWSVTFSSEEGIASCSIDGTIKLWNGRTGKCIKTLRPPRPYEGLKITGIKGLTESQKLSLKELGAVENLDSLSY